VQQFVLEQNVERLKQALLSEQDAAIAATMRARLIADQRELALLLAATAGVRIGPKPPPAMGGDADILRARLDREFNDADTMCMLIDPGPGLIIIDINAIFERQVGVSREAVVGRPLFEAFPENPNETTSSRVDAVYRALRAAGETGRAQELPVRRFDIRNNDGQWEERYWRAIYTPIFDPTMRLAFILQQTVPAERP
jgi:PAS domain-containing protein